jgi:uncharacterized phage protein (TIGR02218 family)
VKTISANMTTHLAGTVTSLCSLWTVTRLDGQVFRFTDHDRNVVYGGNTFFAAMGYDRTAIKNEASLAVDGLNVRSFFDAAHITEADLRAGLYDRAEIHIRTVNWADPDGDGEVKMRRGWFGEVTVPLDSGLFSTELRSLSQALSQQLLEVYQPTCRTDLGSTKCGIPIQPPVLGRLALVAVGQFYRVATDLVALEQAQYENRIYEVTTQGTTAGAQPVYDETPGNTTLDGSAVLTAREAWTRHAVVATVTDRRVFTITVSESRATDGWFANGAITFESGNNENDTTEVKEWIESTSRVTTYLPLPFDIQVGDRLRLYVGCDKLRSTCFERFANVINFRGEPDLPGLDALTRVGEN